MLFVYVCGALFCCHMESEGWFELLRKDELAAYICSSARRYSGYNWEQHKSIKTPRSLVKQLGFTLNTLTLRRAASSMFLH